MEPDQTKPELVNRSLTIDQDLWTRFRIAALKRGQNASEAIRDLIADSLGEK